MRLPLKDLLLGEATSDLARLLQKRENELEDARARIRQLEAALDARAAETAALRRVGAAMGQAVSTDEMLQLVAEVAVQVTGTESSQVYLFNDTRDELVLRATSDPARAGARTTMVCTNFYRKSRLSGGCRPCRFDNRRYEA